MYLSSAIAANLAKGFDMEESVRRAKDYLSGAWVPCSTWGKEAGQWTMPLPLQESTGKNPWIVEVWSVSI